MTKSLARPAGWLVVVVALLLWPEAAAGLLLVAGTLAVWAAAQPHLLVFAAGLFVGRRLLHRGRSALAPATGPGTHRNDSKRSPA
ncbi:hypothetical protein [Streptomyces marincola]|uniref:hypothetical protein n=1 Tax=Streptomyces marincola TaxID=2878388 RepID=UPI001CF1CAF0|nr:hypothetical protein [Streptomyces marincola]UCM89188.1 hypothetical protein LC193_15210 [Streptomyces marincola]